MDLAVLADDELAAPVVGKADADARVLHRAGKADGISVLLGFVKVGLDGLERFDKTRLGPDDLAVRQHLAGADSIAVADLPRGDADKVGHLVQERLGRKAGLRHAEAAERARGRIIRIIGVALDLEIFIVIRACRVRAGALEHRAAEGGKAARVGHDLRLHALNDAVFVAAHRKVHPHRMALGMHQNGFLP